MTKVVYVTGCLGFIGGYITRACLMRGWYVTGVDKETYASNIYLLEEFINYSNFRYIKSDINDLSRLDDCDYVINTAAESAVDASITDSSNFIKSNITGVYNLLRLIQQKPLNSMPILLQFSTDEVYGSVTSAPHTELDYLKPSNPYSGTKASADQLINAWNVTFGIPYILVRPTNNYGVMGQSTEKFIPKTIKLLTMNRKVPMHEQGTPMRTWLHVEDTTSAIMSIIESGVTNEIFNISGNYESTNLDVFKQILSILKPNDNYMDHVDFSVNRPGQDQRYQVDDTKLKSQLAWSNKYEFLHTLPNIVTYYSSNFIW